MPESLIKRNAEGLTQNTVANLITPYISPVTTGMTVWVLTKLATISDWSAGWKIALIISVAAGLTFFLHTLPSLLRGRNNPSADPISPVSESARLIELRDTLDVMRRERDTARTSLETLQAEQKSTLEKLGQCESLRRLEAGEVDRVRGEYQEQLRLAREQTSASDEKFRILRQKFDESEADLDELLSRLSTPKGWVKLKRVRYTATAPGPGGELREKDLTQFFEDKYLEEGKLVIPPGLYRKLFGRQNDPLEGTPKLLEIRFVHAGNEISVLLPENISLTLPFPYMKTEEDLS